MATMASVHHRPLLPLLAACTLVALLAGCGSGSGRTEGSGQATTTTTAPAGSPCATPGLPTTVAYRTIAGVAANLTSLDVWAPAEACRAPVVLWVHGGGYQIGDKRNQIAAKRTLFNAKGWILVSVNYRLTRPGRANSARYPDHYEDVAAAVRWVHDHIGAYGGDPTRLALLGHSAGADIVANVADDPTYLRAQGLDLDALRCAGPLDTAGFDKTAVPAGAEQDQWREALGNDPHYATDTSATLVAKAGTGVPPTIGVYRGSLLRQRIERDYLSAIAATGARTVAIDARTLAHEQVNTSIGAPGDTVMTAPLVAFLTTCFT